MNKHEYYIPNLFKLAAAACLILYIIPPVTGAKNPDCGVCKGIVEKFHEGLKNTAKSGFGGGNTRWEEDKLGAFAFSETRFVEITEKLCGDSAKDCYSMLEEYEELLEKWWFREYAKKKDTDLHTFFCINNVKACCPSGTYGPSCRDCNGGKDRPCKSNGDCNGDGTREGTGKCSCHAGYQGDLCDDCTDKYFEASKNETHTQCTACHESCASTCWEDGPKGCDECAEGWTKSEEEGCVDVDECERDSPCKENEYCSNSPGSHQCTLCDASCQGCTGGGQDKCILCAPRYYKDEDTCKGCHPSCASSCTGEGADKCDACAEGWSAGDDNLCADVNECETGEHTCKENDYCINNQGSYRCSKCMSPCKSCTAWGADKCTECAYGYNMNENQTCIDIDECKEQKPCEGVNEKCVNTKGSFRCDCKKGYVRLEDTCVKQPKDKKKKKTKTKSQTKEEKKEEDGSSIDSTNRSKEEEVKQEGSPPSEKETQQNIPEQEVAEEGQMPPMNLPSLGEL